MKIKNKDLGALAQCLSKMTKSKEMSAKRVMDVVDLQEEVDSLRVKLAKSEKAIWGQYLTEGKKIEDIDKKELNGKLAELMEKEVTLKKVKFMSPAELVACVVDLNFSIVKMLTKYIVKR
jgi:hypothetical protein